VTAGFISGMVLNAVNHRQQLDYVPWNDPIVWRLGGMMAWLVVAAAFSQLYRPANHGRKVAYLTVASFVFLAFTAVLRPLVASQHNPQAETRKQEDKEARKLADRPEFAHLLVSPSPCLLVLSDEVAA
jgi:hypothetical protein